MIKRQDIELLRVFSALGIVWFHSGVMGKDIAYSGLVVFLALSFYFAAQSTTVPKSVLQRSKRLLLPWFVWFVFYGFVNLATHKSFFHIESGIIFGILSGTSIHLWYMPFIFIALVMFDRIQERISPRIIAYASSAFAILIMGSAYIWRPWSLHVGAPIAQYAHALEGVFVGVFLAHYFDLPNFDRSALLLVILALALYLTILPMPGVGIPYLLAIGISAAVLLANNNRAMGLNIGWLSECTLGIYLIHPFYLKIFSYIHLLDGVVVPLAVFSVSALSVWLLKRIAPKISKYAV